MSTFTFITLYSDFPSAPPEWFHSRLVGAGRFDTSLSVADRYSPGSDVAGQNDRCLRRAGRWEPLKFVPPTGENSRGTSHD